VNVVGKVSYQQVRHAYIMLSSSPVDKAAIRTVGFALAVRDGGLPSRSACECS